MVYPFNVCLMFHFSGISSINSQQANASQNTPVHWMLEHNLESAQSIQFAQRVMFNRSSEAVRKYKHRDRCRTFDKTGHCRFGDNCRYLHTTPESPTSAREASISSEVNIHQYQSEHTTQDEGSVRNSCRPLAPGAANPCRTFARTGRCRYEDQCRFSHAFPSERDQRKPDNEYLKDDLKPNPNVNDGSVFLCKVYARTGRCRYEGTCRYAHIPPDVLEARPRDFHPEVFRSNTSANEDPRQKKGSSKSREWNLKNQQGRKSTVNKMKCRFFMAGRCKAGDNCKYFHPEGGPVESEVQPPVETKPTTTTPRWNQQHDATRSARPPVAKVKPSTKPVLTKQIIFRVEDLKEEDLH